MKLSIIFSIICIFFLVNLIGKIYELLWIIVKLKKIGKPYSDEIIKNGLKGNIIYFQEIRKIMEKYGFPMIEPKTLPTRLIKSIKNKTLKKIVNLSFNFWMILIVLSISVTTLSPYGFELVIMNFVLYGLIFLIILQSFNLIFHQYILGQADFIQKSVGLQTIYSDRTEYKFKEWTPNQPFKDFVKLMIRTIISFIIGFTGIYWIIVEFSKNLYSVTAFSQLNYEGLELYINLLYYSVTLMTTTGAGPVSPEWIWVKVIAIIQILVGIDLLIFIILGFSTQLQQSYKVVDKKTQNDKSNDIKPT